MDPRLPKVRLNLVRPSEQNQRFLTQSRAHYRNLIRRHRYNQGRSLDINMKPFHAGPLNTSREAFGFFPTHNRPILQRRQILASAPTGPPAGPPRGPPAGPPRGPPAGPPRGPPAGPQRRMSPIPEAPEVNSNNNEVFEVPVNTNPVTTLMGQLEIFKRNRAQIEAQIDSLEANARENRRPSKKRRTLVSTNRVTGQTRAELEETLGELQEELDFIDREIEQLQMQLGEHTRASTATAAPRRGGKYRSTRRRHRTARRQKPRA